MYTFFGKFGLSVYLPFVLLSFSGTEGNDLWVWHDTQEGDDYVIMGHTRGSSFVRITDPVNPVPLGVLDTE